MKKKYFLAAIAATLLSVGTLLAQPTLTYANMSFAPGLTYTNLMHPSTGVQAGPGGANQTWNFSQVGQGSNALVVTVHETAGSAFANTFPGSTHYTTNTGNNSKGFVAFQTSGYSVTGLLGGGASPDFTYTDPMKMMTYPFTYNSSFTDTYTANYTTNGIAVTRQGNINAVADGYGTIILPNGQTYTDVLRFHVTDQITDNIMGTPFTTSTDSYYWYKIGLPAGLFSIVSSSGMGQTSTAVVSLQLGAVGIAEDLAGKTSIYPNPASGNVTIANAFEETANATATLVNNLGQELRKQIVSTNENQFSLEGISSGVYFLQLQSGGSTVTKKLIVK